MADGWSPRAVCYRCDKPQAMCLCARIPRVDNRTRVLVLQHPRERTHAIGTARFARLGLQNARVEIAWDAGRAEADTPAWVPPGTALLFPTAHARDLHALPPEQRPRQLLVLDGTWRTAASLYRDKAWLQRLPHVRFSPAQPSRYRLRLQPMRECVSTIEAIVEALRVLEPETAGLDALLGAFDAMIDDQLAHVLRGEGPRRARVRRPAALRRLPEAITGGFARIVLVGCESVRLPDGARALVQVSACALASGALRQWHVRLPSGQPPDARMLAYMGLTLGDYAGALDLGGLRAAWDAFLQLQPEPPIVAAWNQSALDLLAAAGARAREPLVLKSAYRGRCGTQLQHLEDVVRALELPLPLAIDTLRGRAAQRLACAAAVAHYLHGLAAEPAEAPAAAASGAQSSIG